MAARTGRTVTSLVDEALRQMLLRREAPPERQRFEMVTFRGSGANPGVDLDDTAALQDLMDERAAP